MRRVQRAPLILKLMVSREQLWDQWGVTCGYMDERRKLSVLRPWLEAYRVRAQACPLISITNQVIPNQSERTVLESSVPQISFLSSERKPFWQRRWGKLWLAQVIIMDTLNPPSPPFTPSNLTAGHYRPYGFVIWVPLSSWRLSPTFYFYFFCF